MNKNVKSLRTAALVFGPMGAGKSEISKKLIDNTGIFYINPDLFWDRASGMKFTRDIGDKNFSQAYGQMIYCMQTGKSFLLDSALRGTMARQEVTSILRTMDNFVPDYNFHIIGFYVTADLEICLKRNKQRPGGQPDDVIKNYYESFKKEPPSKSEGFDKLYTIKNNGETVPNIDEYLDLIF
ncbi:MAG: AAA family ATPase [Candidatus Pacearchaeota archaeon]|nr:AAA family ATPase [Candidatus Pacearchaeota archaeon]